MANMPYIVSEITPKRATTLKKRGDEILKVKYNLSQFKLYVKRKVLILAVTLRNLSWHQLTQGPAPL